MKELIINILHCYINNLRILVSKFLSHIFGYPLKKATKNLQFTAF